MLTQSTMPIKKMCYNIRRKKNFWWYKQAKEFITINPCPEKKLEGLLWIKRRLKEKNMNNIKSMIKLKKGLQNQRNGKTQ